MEEKNRDRKSESGFSFYRFIGKAFLNIAAVIAAITLITVKVFGKKIILSIEISDKNKGAVKAIEKSEENDEENA